VGAARRLVVQPERSRSPINRGADWKELSMSMSGMQLGIGETTDPDAFDLDIRIVEFGDAAVTVVNVTDDGCGSTCPRACATNVG
jgi:FxLD family lantipeptide